MIEKTRITEMFGIKYPIIQAPMNWITGPKLVAAVSAAGGLGTLGPNAGQTTPTYDPKELGERLRSQIKKVRELTDKPFLVNLPVGGTSGKGKELCDACVQTVVEERVAGAVVIMGSPDMYTTILKNAGVKVIHAVTTAHHAQRAEAAGVDAVVAEGYEGGGHLGKTDLSTMVLVPQVVNAVKIPVIGGGGIYDGRGLVAVRALGGEAVYMGTRFVATLECDAHQNFKQSIIDAKDTSTVVVGKKIGLYLRIIANGFSSEFFEKEAQGASTTDLANLWSYPGGDDFTNPLGLSRMYFAFVKGDVDKGSPAAGAISGAIKEITSAGDVVRQVIEEAQKVVKRITAV